MKKKITISVVIALILTPVFLIPIPKGAYDDGGSREYAALTYKIVKWNRMVSVYDADGNMERIDQYDKTSVYWFPDNLKSIDELWRMEYEKN